MYLLTQKGYCVTTGTPCSLLEYLSMDQHNPRSEFSCKMQFVTFKFDYLFTFTIEKHNSVPCKVLVPYSLIFSQQSMIDNFQ